MATINLLPWREQKREEARKQFLAILAVAAISTIFLFLCLHLVIAQKINSQQNLNLYVENQIRALENKIGEINALKSQKALLIERLAMIQSLEANRPLTVHVFDEIPRILPDGVFLTAVERIDNSITLAGQAQSNTRVSQLMQNIEKSTWLTAPILLEIKTTVTSIGQANNFKLQMQQIMPPLSATTEQKK